MQTRSFSVYVDTPSSEVQTSKATNSASDSAPSSITSLSDINALTTVANKENFHPVTGERVTYSSTGKKRKTTVLAVKACSSKDASAIGESSDSQPQQKKRKAASSSSRVKAKKDDKVLGVSRKGLKKSTRRASPLPKVEEEKEEKAKDVAGMSQVAINSRCYELTVSPLADVSEAYDETVGLGGFLAEGEIHSPFVKDASTEPQLRDYFSQSPPSIPSRLSKSSREPSQERRVFTTPERKHIYAAFTFTSPSPVKKITRSTSAPLLASPSKSS